VSIQAVLKVWDCGWAVMDGIPCT